MHENVRQPGTIMRCLCVRLRWVFPRSCIFRTKVGGLTTWMCRSYATYDARQRVRPNSSTNSKLSSARSTDSRTTSGCCRLQSVNQSSAMGVLDLGLGHKESLRTILKSLALKVKSLALAFKDKSLALAFYLSPCSHHCHLWIFRVVQVIKSL